ncbi:hypothetical protein MPSEU_000677100 [Mayamaea pseudoterrestris]|nr:hypothetical protein MPSEU_000677100 [Mayamaea pseudoterrestris]
MTCSNEAIPHVSYPVAVLAKSCKLIPTMLVGQFLERKSYNRSEWMAALCISCGIVLFHATRLSKSNDLHHAENNQQRRNFGMLLLMISLLSDGLLGTCQNLIKLCSLRDASLLPPTAVQTMYYVNLYALVFLVPLSIYNGQLRLATLQRIFVNEPVLSWNLLLLNASAGIGQVYIFLTITWYSPVVCTTITTTRKFVTILLSVYAFGHSFSMLQWVSMVLVFGGLYTVVWVQHDKQMQQQQQQHIGPLQKERIVGGDDEISQSVAIKAKVD